MTFATQTRYLKTHISRSRQRAGQLALAAASAPSIGIACSSTPAAIRGPPRPPPTGPASAPSIGIACSSVSSVAALSSEPERAPRAGARLLRSRRRFEAGSGWPATIDASWVCCVQASYDRFGLSPDAIRGDDLPDSSTRTCLFCRASLSGARAREHVFPTWLRQAMDVEVGEVTQTHVAVDGDSAPARRHTLSAFVEGRVCERCNSGWMSRLETDVKSALLGLSRGEVEIDDVSLSERRDLSRWTAKTA